MWESTIEKIAFYDIKIYIYIYLLKKIYENCFEYDKECINIV